LIGGRYGKADAAWRLNNGFRHALGERAFGQTPDANFRLNIFGMENARRRLIEAGVLDWGKAGPLDDLRYVAGEEERETLAFQKRFAAWVRGVVQEDFTRSPTPGKVIAAKLFFNDGFVISPVECGVIASMLASAPEDHLRAFAGWCRTAEADGGVAVW